MRGEGNMGRKARKALLFGGILFFCQFLAITREGPDPAIGRRAMERGLPQAEEFAGPRSTDRGQRKPGLPAPSGVSTPQAGEGAISGHVADLSDAAIQSIRVRVLDLYNANIADAYTDSSGNYTISGLTPGNYRVYFDNNGMDYFPEWYDDQGSYAAADTVVVVTSTTTADINAQLAPAGRISGQVTNAAYASIEGIWVVAYTTAGDDLVQSLTDASGNYALTGLPAGSYKVVFDAASEYLPYLSGWHNNKRTFALADPVNVTIGSPLYINAQLASNPTDPPNTDQAHARTLTAGTYENQMILFEGDVRWFKIYVTEGKDLVAATSNNQLVFPEDQADIDLSIRNEAGSILVQATSSAADEAIAVANVAAGWYYICIDYARTGTYTLTLSSGDLALGEFRGRVTDHLGNGVPGVQVQLFNADSESWDLFHGYVPTDGMGYYRYAHDPGTYKVKFDVREAANPNVANEYYDNKESFVGADPITLSVGQTLNEVNAELNDTLASISGQVTDPSSNPLLARVYAVDENGITLTYAWTDSYGNYIIRSLPVGGGSYRVLFRSGGYAATFYNQKSTLGAADPVTVSSGETTTGINAQLEPQGRIRGRVTDADGAGLANITVVAYDTAQTGRALGSGVTDAAGVYTILRLPTASVRVLFNADGTSYASEWYSGKASFETADPVAVTAGATTLGIDAQLGSGGTIAGTVTDTITSLGLGGIQVEVYDAGEQLVTRDATLADGTYSLAGVPAGTYKVYFYHPGGNYFPAWFNGKSTFAAADAVVVTAGLTHSEIDAALVPLTITVISPNGGEVWTAGSDHDITWTHSGTFAYVRLDYSTDDGAGWNPIVASAPNSGSYSWHVPSISSSRLRVRVGKADYGPSDSSDASFTILTVGDGGVAGRVTDPEGGGIAGVKVAVWNLQTESVAETLSDAGGYYALAGVAEGIYKVQFKAYHVNTLPFISEWHGDKYTYADATLVAVSAGSVLTVNAQLAHDTGPSNHDQANALLLTPGTYDNIAVINYADRGWYKIYVAEGKDLMAACHDVRFFDPLNAAANDMDILIRNEAGEVLVAAVSSGADEMIYAADLPAGWYYVVNDYPMPSLFSLTVDTGDLAVGEIRGRVTGSLGNGLAGVIVYLYEELDPDWAKMHGQVTTDVNGNYRFAHDPGRYKVNFNPNAGEDPYTIGEWYNDKASHVAADVVTIQLGQVTSGIDAQLQDDGAAISGRVTDGSSNPLMGVVIEAFDASGVLVRRAYSDASGNYILQHLRSSLGNCRVRFRWTSAWTTIWYQNKASFGVADAVTLASRTTTPGIDAMLLPCSKIGGTVSDAAGNPLAGIQVLAYDTLQTIIPICSTTTNDSGNYALWRLPAGTMRVFFNAAGSGYASEWFDDKGGFTAADAVTVGQGQTVSGINAKLTPGFTVTFVAGSGGTLAVQQGTIVQSVPLGGSTTPVTAVANTDYHFVNWSGDYSGTDNPLTISNITTNMKITANFVVNDLLSVVFPNGGESWTVGESQGITWTSTGTIANVNIDCSANNGGDWTPVVAGTANDGSYYWTVANAPSTTCLVRVSDTDGDPSDTSNAVFTIAASSTETVSAPNTLTGPSTGLISTSYDYSTGGSTSSLGHSVQYKFDWDDGSDSGWLATGTTDGVAQLGRGGDIRRTGHGALRRPYDGRVAVVRPPLRLSLPTAALRVITTRRRSTRCCPR